MIKVTDAAAQQIREAAAQSTESNTVLRIAARRMPDGGIDHTMGFDEEKPMDMRLTANDIDIVIARESKILTQGLILDYVELEPDDHRFIFNNPNDKVAGQDADQDAQADPQQGN